MNGSTEKKEMEESQESGISTFGDPQKIKFSTCLNKSK
jgi:hypothetical protein